MKNSIYTLLFSLLISSVFAQPNLLPSIGIGDLPEESAAVCDIPLYLGSFETSGFQEGDFVSDFNLYDVADNQYQLSQIMEDGKPVLLVGGNYTCPVFRNKVPIINEIVSTYGNALNVFIINGVEAHPVNDISPYFGFENVTNSNYQNNILYEQPDTYGERKAIVADMLNALNIAAPVLIDGPCNEWWENFGPAPNNAYLIDADGSVFSKHGWFHKYPDDMICDIEALLNNSSDCGEDTNGAFEFFLTGDTIAYGEAGNTLFVYAMLENNSDTGVEIEISRLQENIPADWASSMCIDVCYSADVSYTTIFLESGESKLYTMYFYTSEVPGEGNIRMGFRNVNDLQNKYIQWMYASTMTTDVEEVLEIENTSLVFPNPVETTATLSIPMALLNISDNLEWQLFDSNGKLVKFEIITDSTTVLDLNDLPAGIYSYGIFDKGRVIDRGKILVID